MQGTEQLRIVAVVALIAVLLAHGLPLAASAAEELYMRRVTTRYQAAQHTSTAASERGFSRARFHQSFVFFALQLTVVGIAMCLELGQRRRTSLHPQHHAQHE
jgi:hypothetical protein